jgi:hypothetical protein
LSLQVFDQAKFEAVLNSASRGLLADRSAAAVTMAKLGHLPLMLALELIEQAGYPRALPRLVAAASVGKPRLHGTVDGKPHRKIKPECLHYLAFEPDSGVLYFNREAAWQHGVEAPCRASNVTVEAGGIEEVWPEATQERRSDMWPEVAPKTGAGGEESHVSGGDDVAAPTIEPHLTKDPPLASEQKKTAGQRGRKLGSGRIKEDDNRILDMLRLLASGDADNSWRAANCLMIRDKLPGKESTQRRLSRKFRDKWGTSPEPGKTWKDILAEELNAN